jgi:hypothetical protein
MIWMHNQKVKKYQEDFLFRLKLSDTHVQASTTQGYRRGPFASIRFLTTHYETTQHWMTA